VDPQVRAEALSRESMACLFRTLQDQNSAGLSDGARETMRAAEGEEPSNEPVEEPNNGSSA
jgi:hypothetical protein